MLRHCMSPETSEKGTRKGLPAGVVDKLRKMLAFLFLPEVLKVASELTDSFHVAA
jgi:hypothetical protein